MSQTLKLIKKGKSRKDISVHNNIYEILREYEPLRKKFLFYFLFLETLILIGGGFGIYNAFGLIGDNSEQYAGLGVLMIIFVCPLYISLLVCLPSLLNNIFSKILKRKCFQRILKTITDIRVGNQHLDYSVLQASSLFQHYNFTEYDDTFEYKDNNRFFRIDETTLLHKKGYFPETDLFPWWTKNVRKYFSKIIFQGIIIDFTSSKFHKDKIFVVPKNDFKNIFSHWLNILPIIEHWQYTSV